MQKSIKCGRCSVTSEYEITYENKTFVHINCNSCGVINKVEISVIKNTDEINSKSRLQKLYDEHTSFTDLNLKPLSTNSDGHLINYGWDSYSGDDEDLSDQEEEYGVFGFGYESSLYEENDEDEWEEENDDDWYAG